MRPVCTAAPTQEVVACQQRHGPDAWHALAACVWHPSADLQPGETSAVITQQEGLQTSTRTAAGVVLMLNKGQPPHQQVARRTLAM
jgi:hypothetical protein